MTFNRYDHHCILSVCLALHGHVTGSSDPLQPAELRERVMWLRYRLTTWQPTPCDSWVAFDDSVRAVVMATLLEVDAASIGGMLAR